MDCIGRHASFLHKYRIFAKRREWCLFYSQMVAMLSSGMHQQYEKNYMHIIFIESTCIYMSVH